MNFFHLILCWLLPIAATVISGTLLQDYQARLEATVEAMQRASTAEREATLARIAVLLPRQEDILLGQQPIKVNNGWLHRSINEFYRQTDKKSRDVTYDETLRRLSAMLENVQSTSHLAARDVRQDRHQLAEILSQREFQHQGSMSWWDRAQSWLRDVLAGLFQNLPQLTRDGDLPSSILIGLIWIATAVILFYLVKGNFGLTKRPASPESSGQRTVMGFVLEAHGTADDLRRQAHDLEQQGEYREASRLLYISLLYELEQWGLLQLAASATNRDYLDVLKANSALYHPMEYLTQQVEQFWYGKLLPSMPEYEDFLQKYQKALGTVNHQWSG